MVLRFVSDRAGRGSPAAWWATALSALVGVMLGLAFGAVAPSDPLAMGPVAVVVAAVVGLVLVTLGGVTRGVAAPLACCGSFLAVSWLCSPAERLVFVSDRDTPGRTQLFAVSAAGGRADRLTASSGQDTSPALAVTGRLAFTRQTGDRERIYVADTNGAGVMPLSGGEGNDHHPAWSPDGRWLAFASDRSGDWEIYVVASDGSQLRGLTRSPGRDDWPAWSPDGNQLAFASDRDGQARLFIIDSDGEGLTVFQGGNTPVSQPAWSPDGRRLAFVATLAGGDNRICTALLDGDQRRCLTPPGRYSAPAWSPAGARLAYAAASNGGGSIFIIPATGGTPRKLSQSASFDSAPTWARSGPQFLSARLIPRAVD